MKKTNSLFLFIALNLFFANFVHAALFNAVANGAWEDANVWDQGLVPGLGDIVTIDGFQLSLSSPVTVAELTLTNTSGTGHSQLIISSVAIAYMYVSGNFYMNAQNTPYNVDLHVKGQAIFKVFGDMNITRAADNQQSASLRLYLYGKSETYVDGNLNYLYKNSATGESSPDILLEGTALLDVDSVTSLLMQGGKSLQVLAQDSSSIDLASLTIHGSGGEELIVQSIESSKIVLSSDALVKNSGTTQQVKLATGHNGGQIGISGSLQVVSTGPNLLAVVETNGPNSSTEVKGDITMTAEGANTVYLNIFNESPLSVGGSIIRSTSYGNLISSNGGQLILNGSSQQSISGENDLTANVDQFSIENITFSNISGLPIMLGGDLLFTTSLTLTTGNIITSDNAMLIIGPGATINGASENAYIQGPLKKIGNTGGNDFVFPIGSASQYAPMRISPVSSAGSSYIARYDGDPPPFGENKIGVEQVTGNQTWSIEPALGSDSINVTLYWDDATVMGAELQDEIIVVGLDDADFWNNKGNTSVSLTEPGHVTSIMLGDPPPFGEHILTLGLAPEGSLPVELTKFGAVQQNDKVYLEWYTSSEINSSHFELERSTDKENFILIYTVNSTGTEELSMKYSTLDNIPAQGMNYYRLKMIDQDGSFEYSHVEVVKLAAEAEIMIYPNPVLNMLQIQGGMGTGIKTFEVYDRNGLLLHQRNISFDDGKFEISVDEINVTVPGTYFMRIIDGAESKVVKFLKVK